MQISVIQTNMLWENPIANCNALEEKISALSNSDIVVLPEMFTTGFSMKPELLAEEPEGKTFKWLVKCAKHNKIAITGSYIVCENGNYYNRMYFVKPNGDYTYYNKRHLFRMGNEHEHYSVGNNRVVINYMKWNILLLVCYDLRFPVWSRNLNNEYDLIIICANWPKSRNHAWKTLLAARSIENQCYLAACNRIGFDGDGNEYSGDSAIYNPKGLQLATAQMGIDETITASLNLDEINEFRQKFPVSLDSDSFLLK